MENDVMVDSNVFIDLMKFQGDPGPPLVRWAGSRNLALCGMIRLEVLRGVKALKARHALSGFMDVMVNVPSDQRLWEEAADLAWKLDRRGLGIPGPDAMIAASALRLGAAIMTSASHFRKIDGLQVIAPPAEWFR